MSVQAQSSLSSDSLAALRIKSKDLSTARAWSCYHHFSQHWASAPADSSSQSTHGPLSSSASPSLSLLWPQTSSSSSSLLPFLQSLLHSHFLQGALNHLHLTRAAAPPSHSTLTNPVTLPTYFSASHP